MRATNEIYRMFLGIWEDELFEKAQKAVYGITKGKHFYGEERES